MLAFDGDGRLLSREAPAIRQAEDAYPLRLPQGTALVLVLETYRGAEGQTQTATAYTPSDALDYDGDQARGAPGPEADLPLRGRVCKKNEAFCKSPFHLFLDGLYYMGTIWEVSIVKHVLALLLACLFALSLAGCGTEAANPLVTVDGPEDFKKTGVSIEAPLGSEKAVYTIVDGKVAQVEYTLSGLSFVYRGSTKVDGEALHGIYETFDPEETTFSAESDRWSVTMTIRTVEGGEKGALVLWSHGSANYTLWTPDPVSVDALAMLAVDLGSATYQ